jgi:hypothetical protein
MIADWLARVEGIGGWIGSGISLLLLKRLRLLNIQFDGLNVKYVKGEKRESFREGQQNERDRDK